MPSCKKCQKSFPSYVKINGKTRNLSKRSYCLECSPFGLKNRKRLNIQSESTRKCAMCNKFLCKSMFSKKRKGSDQLYSYCKPCDKKRQSQKQLEFKTKCVNYKGGSCVLCGYSKCIAALDFHHKNPNEKQFGISSKNYTQFNNETKKELDKCDLICSNCHRELHFNEDK